MAGLIIFIGVLVVLIAFFVYQNNKSGDYNEFAQCLTDAGVSMGGTDWCSHCSDQKAMFGNSFEFIDYHNCDFEESWCTEHGITGFPTWVFSDGPNRPGVQQLRTLADLSGCEI